MAEITFTLPSKTTSSFTGLPAQSSSTLRAPFPSSNEGRHMWMAAGKNTCCKSFKSRYATALRYCDLPTQWSFLMTYKAMYQDRHSYKPISQLFYFILWPKPHFKTLIYLGYIFTKSIKKNTSIPQMIKQHTDQFLSLNTLNYTSLTKYVNS